MPDNPDYGRRLREAKRAWEKDHDTDLTWKEIGIQIGGILKRDPVDPTVVHRWFNKGREPKEFAVTVAIADLLGVTAGWLAFGEEPHISYRATLPPPGQNAENLTAVPKPHRSQARRQKRA